MESSARLWDRSRSDQELQEMFKKIVRVNRVHSRLPALETVAPVAALEKDEFYNFISIIINPDQDSSVTKLLMNLYDQIDLGAILSLFYKEAQTDFGALNLDAIARLRKLFEEVF